MEETDKERIYVVTLEWNNFGPYIAGRFYISRKMLRRNLIYKITNNSHTKFSLKGCEFTFYNVLS
jgi:hypothetical protein